MTSPTAITRSAGAAATSPAKKCAYVTFLLTSPSYLPGILLLAHSLRNPTTGGPGSAYPLIVAVNPALPRECINALEQAGLEVRIVQPLVPRGKVTIIAERFVDTWTKLRVWEFDEFEVSPQRGGSECGQQGLVGSAPRRMDCVRHVGSRMGRSKVTVHTMPGRLILIDGDMMIRQSMDELFHMPLPKDMIACNHACVCNLDKSSWAPADWTRENCAYTPTSHPDALLSPVQPSATPNPHTLLNSGLVVLTPSRVTMNRITSLLASEKPEEQDLIASWMFPDQDALAHVFQGKWQALPWCYNALKTMRYWHGNFWRDDQVRNVHYICDKPWKRRPALKHAHHHQAEGEDDHSSQQDNAERSPAANPVDQPINPTSRYKCTPGPFLEIRDEELGLPAEQADAVTHGWWWDAYDQMRAGLQERGYGSLRYLDVLVAQ
ncbi:hypothetical protein QFC22_006068 [Naganishia vaughanmartiniae]|uniref:Uncharacterized protein n=1 Tax=Naganishia vaughanmartiniae TaxID=1424756 RepID=A0ACC2WNA5_9TREE|nr:hypothetical protein QFC22_006068 [Naganishia vaughanmartiniae]